MCLFCHCNNVNNVFFRLTGGESEEFANLAEGMATTLVCFDDLNEMRDQAAQEQVTNYCILVCNSAPYSMPIMECQQYEGKTAEQMASIFYEVRVESTINRM